MGKAESGFAIDRSAQVASETIEMSILSKASPIQLMVTAVFLWALYPPVANLLLDHSSPLALGAVLNLCGALTSYALCRGVFGVRPFAVLARECQFGRLDRCQNPQRATLTRRFLLYAAITGVIITMISATLFYALDGSTRYDATAILIFETWPVLFFVADTALNRDAVRVRPRDWIYVAVTFLGFALLMAQRIDFAEWILLSPQLIDVAAFALAGSMLMTAAVFVRRRAVLMLEPDLDHPMGPAIHRIIVLEIIGLGLSGVLMAVLAMATGTFEIDFGAANWGLVVLAGSIFIGASGALYHLALLRHTNASISAMWYLVPAGSLIFLAIIDRTLPTAYETVAAVLIVSANLLLALRLNLQSAFLRLYVFLVVAGVVLIAVPPFTVPNFLDVVAVSSIFFVLLITHALTAQQHQRGARERALVELNGQLHAVDAAAAPDQKLAIARYMDAVFHLFVSAGDPEQAELASDRIARERRWAQSHVAKAEESLRHALEALNTLSTVMGDRLGGGMTVVLTLLFTANVGVVLLMREAGPLFDVFALLIATVEAYLFFLVLERDSLDSIGLAQRSALRQIRALRRLWNWQSSAPRDWAEVGAIYRRKPFVLPGRNDADGVRVVAGLSIIAFVMFGLVYSIVYKYHGAPQFTDASPIETARGAMSDDADIVIGYPSWPTARIQAEILAQVLNDTLQIETAFADASSNEMFMQMDAGAGVGVHPEVWSEPLAEALRRYALGYKTVRHTPGGIDGWQGYCVNEAGRRALAGRGVAALRDDAVFSAFDPDGDGRAPVWLGAPGWSSIAAEEVRLRAYGLDARFEAQIYSEELLLKALDLFAEQDRPYLFSCYSPSVLMMRDDTHRVAEPAFAPADWERVAEAVRTGGALAQPVASAARPVSNVGIAYAAWVAQRHPDAARLFANYTPTPADFEMWSRSYQAGNVTPEAIARDWIAANEARILAWMLP